MCQSDEDMNDCQTSQEKLYRLLPSVDAMVLQTEFAELRQGYTRAVVTGVARAVLRRLREQVADGLHTENSLLNAVKELPVAIMQEAASARSATLVPVLNATGVILHTNLGRAPLSEAAVQAIVQVAVGYSNLEFDLATGERGHRDRHAGPMLLHVLHSLTGGSPDRTADDWAVAVVNNCAAATFLGLHSLAEGGEVVVSRGELVEIGGGFRIPEILRKAGVVLREVGTTNRTRLADYASAVNGNTRMILRVHQSNFSMEGFTEKPELAALIALGRATGVAVFEDQGTGLMVSLNDLDLNGQSSLPESFRLAPDLIAASGDKLLGGPQCGLLLGRRDFIELIQKNPLFRAFRVDKLTYAALEATLASYAMGTEGEIPTVRMLRITTEALRKRCEVIRDALVRVEVAHRVEVSVVPTQSVIGGGTSPGATLESYAVSLQHRGCTASTFVGMLRQQTPPVIARVQHEAVLLDLRTVPPEKDGMLVRALLRAAAGVEE